MYLEHLSCKNYRKTKYKYRDIKIFEKPTTKSICQWFQQRNTIISLLRCEDLTVFFVCVFCSFTFCTWFIVSNLQYSIDYYYYGCMNAFSVTRFRAYRLFYCFASRIIFFFFSFSFVMNAVLSSSGNILFLKRILNDNLFPIDCDFDTFHS